MRIARKAGAGVVIALIVVVCAGGVPTNRYLIAVNQDQGASYVQVVGFKIGLGKSSFGEIGDNQDARDRWYIIGGKIKHSVTGRYLAYDPSGERRTLTLTDKPVPGTDWTVSLKKRSPGDEERGTLAAAEGKVKGWHLVLADGQLALAPDGPDKFEAQRVYSHK